MRSTRSIEKKIYMLNQENFLLFEVAEEISRRIERNQDKIQKLKQKGGMTEITLLDKTLLNHYKKEAQLLGRA